MKFFSLLFSLLLLLLSSCQLNTKEKPVSIIEEHKSIIQRWYGSDHFTTPSDSESEANSCQSEEAQNAIENTTPAGNIFSKEFIESHSSTQLPEQEFLFSQHLFQDASDLDSMPQNLHIESHAQ